jgi:hypothetical protein
VREQAGVVGQRSVAQHRALRRARRARRELDLRDVAGVDCDRVEQCRIEVGCRRRELAP